MKPAQSTLCPCGSPQNYADCCGAYHAGSAAPSAEALMRSRYSAFVFQLEAYLLATWHSSTRPSKIDLATDQKTHWLGLEIKRHETSGPASALVEFIARAKTGGRARRMHEISRFVCEDGRWFYVDGEYPAQE
jgi:SEC-C motif-containing protein